MGLVTETLGVSEEGPFWLAWRIRRDNGWHTYWKFPGDGGEPPTVLWDLPPGLQAGELIFPAPQRIMMAQVGAHGHTGETLYLCKFEPKVPFRVGEMNCSGFGKRARRCGTLDQKKGGSL